MAKKRRRLLSGKRRKKSKNTRGKSKKRRAKRRSRSIGGKISGAYRTVVDTIKGTDRLRNKLEPPATSETE
jgi:PBP1b-binding outer membrane lipoprotein LpoB